MVVAMRNEVIFAAPGLRSESQVGARSWVTIGAGDDADTRFAMDSPRVAMMAR